MHFQCVCNIKGGINTLWAKSRKENEWQAGAGANITFCVAVPEQLTEAVRLFSSLCSRAQRDAFRGRNQLLTSSSSFRSRLWDKRSRRWKTPELHFAQWGRERFLHKKVSDAMPLLCWLFWICMAKLNYQRRRVHFARGQLFKLRQFGSGRLSFAF